MWGELTPLQVGDERGKIVRSSGARRSGEPVASKANLGPGARAAEKQVANINQGATKAQGAEEDQEAQVFPTKRGRSEEEKASRGRRRELGSREEVVPSGKPTETGETTTRQGVKNPPRAINK